LFSPYWMQLVKRRKPPQPQDKKKFSLFTPELFSFHGISILWAAHQTQGLYPGTCRVHPKNFTFQFTMYYDVL
jgi:hypothetical protein